MWLISCDGIAERLEFHPGDRVAFLRHNWADAWPELLAPLTAGAQLVFEPREDATVVYITPSVARSMTAVQLNPAPHPALRWTVFSGAALSAHIVQQWWRSFPNSGRVLNLYGRREVGGTQQRLRGAGPAGARGTADRSRASRCSSADRRGGRNDLVTPARSARSRSISTPTGDMGRLRADGEFTFEARRDREVKIRGRVQPAEIERAIGIIPGVERVVVTTDMGVSGETRLAASVVAGLPVRAIAAALREVLPRSMIPAIVPAAGHESGMLTSRGPRIESSWRCVVSGRSCWRRHRLACATISSALGGHSLLAVQLVARIESRFGLRRPAHLLPDATIEHLAHQISMMVATTRRGRS